MYLLCKSKETSIIKDGTNTLRLILALYLLYLFMYIECINLCYIFLLSLIIIFISIAMFVNNCVT